MILSDVSRGGGVVWYHDCSRKLECGTMNNLEGGGKGTGTRSND